jgi:hypothetical protein
MAAAAERLGISPVCPASHPTRIQPARRRHVGVDAPSIVVSAPERLTARHELDGSVRDKAIEADQLDVANGPSRRQSGRPGQVSRVTRTGRTTAVHGRTR